MNTEVKSGIQVYLDYLREHWALAASVGYLYLTTIGMIQSGIIFSKYEINIFEFSEINDFLLAAFREPISLLAGFGVLAYVGIAFAVLYRKNSERRPGSILFRSKAMMWNLFLSALLMPILTQVLFADFFKGSYERNVALELRRGALPGITDLSKAEFKLIGTSENFVFVHERKLGQSFIVPTSNLVGLAIKP